MSSQVNDAYVGRQINSSAASLLDVFIGKAFLLWPSEVTKGLTAFWGQTAACQQLMSPTGGQGSIFKMIDFYPVIREPISVRECQDQRGRDAWLLLEIQPGKDILGT